MGRPLGESGTEDELAPARGVLRAAAFGAVLWAFLLVGCTSVTGEYERHGILLPPEAYRHKPDNPVVHIELPSQEIVVQCGMNETTKLFSGATRLTYSRECTAVGLEYWQAQLFLISRLLWDENSAQVVSNAKEKGLRLDIVFLPNDAPEVEYEALGLHALGHRNGWNTGHTN